MKLAIIGSRGLCDVDIANYLPKGVNEIVSGGANGIDCLARELAEKKGIRLVEFLPNYARYGKGAPLVRNKEIVAYADEALVFWDGRSRGTAHTLRLFENLQKKVTLFIMEDKNAPHFPSEK